MAKYTPVQAQTIRTALTEAYRLHASAKVRKALIEAGYTESRWQPLDHGDRDSEGFLQQRPSQGWGTPAQVRDVKYATRQFVKRANPIAGKYGSAGQLAQAVQRSATPGYFDKVAGIAESALRQFDDGLTGGGSTALTQAAGGGLVQATPGDTSAVDALVASFARPGPVSSGALPGTAHMARAVLPRGAVASGVVQSSPVSPQPSIADTLAAAAGLQGTPPEANPTQTTSTGGGGAQSGTAGPSAPAGKGRVSVAQGANRAGVGIQKVTLNFVAGVAARARGGGIRVTTGTNHNRLTVNGNVSDHWDGHATDIAVPIDSHRGDVIATAALVQAGVPAARARQMAKRGGLYTLTHGGLRIQVIWKTYQGGNHHNHVHIGARPA